MEAKLEIINLFSKDVNTQLTIRQISIAIKKSYAFTNTVVRQMISDNLMLKKNVGRAILCTLNFKNSYIYISLTYQVIV